MLSLFVAGAFASALYAVADAATTPPTYRLNTRYSGANFFDNFQFFTDPDPTNGYVQYVDRYTAKKNGLISTTTNTSYMGVDYTTNLTNSNVGRQSVRIQSNKTFTQGLLVGDFQHFPGGICGTWPAFWSYGNNWPYNGEIDMFEGINSYKGVLQSLHTGPNCTVAGTGQSSTLLSNDCNYYNSSENGAGCSSLSSNSNTYSNFNANGGGVFATEWTSQAIRMWFFPRNSIPIGLSNGDPEPQNWGTPLANFQGSCNISHSFANHQIVLNTDLCGNFAGSAWPGDATCKSLAPTCNDYVKAHPAAFKNAYWLVNHIEVYTAIPTSTSTAAATSSKAAVQSAKPVTTLKRPANAAAGASGTTPVGVSAAASATSTRTLTQTPVTAR